ncbi:peroxiredoxin [Candidatus Gracilibacteria bacterium]|nr:MAG: peroxiredoxin [Candidatus Gracilibacteria bacterium]PIE85656.1 MAG: peroxiredoxin [Candidatus Gracilibacteria bacterium]
MNLENKYKLLSFNLKESELSLGEILSSSPNTLLYFYPKDNTPGCSTEGKDFTFLKNNFSNIGINIVGVSKDSIESHKKFIEKQDLKINLLSDPDLILHKELGVYGEKMNYGKKIMGVIRSTFLFDKNGKLLKKWINVRAKGHAERILDELS